MSRVTLRERFFPLHQPDDVDRFLFENEWGRAVRAARLVAVEFQGQLAGRLEPLKARAARMLERLSGR
jgi:hypothetical protein